MSAPSARRALLFDTPMRPTKRMRTSKSRRSRPMRLPRSLLPEMKQFTASQLTSSTTGFASSSVATDMNQGTLGSEFVGKTFRVKRLRLYYDMAKSTPTGYDGSAIRLFVYISKRPGTVLTSPLVGSSVDPVDGEFFTVFADRIVPTGENTNAGTIDVKMNLPIDTGDNGTFVYRNDLRVAIFANGATSGSTLNTNVGYTVWFTDT